MGGEHQAATNRTGRATLGTFRSNPLGVVAAENSLTQRGSYPTTARLGSHSDSWPDRVDKQEARGP